MSAGLTAWTAERHRSDGPGARSWPPRPQLVATALLLAAMAWAAVDQGAFQDHQAFVLEAGVVLSLIVAVLGRRPVVGELTVAPVLACGAVAAWVLLRSVAAGEVAGSLADVLLLLSLAVVVVVVRRANSDERRMFQLGLLLLGTALAGNCWASIAWHAAVVNPGGILRTGSTFGYANVAATFFAVLALIALARVVAEPRSLGDAFIAYVLVVGAAATLSRSGGLALLAGTVVLAATMGWRRTVVAVWPTAVGSALALVALTPSLRADLPGKPLVAALGLAAGGALALGAPRLSRLVVAPLAVVLAVVMAVGGQAQLEQVSTRIGDERFSTQSLGRTEIWVASLRVIGDAPLTGTGPGRFRATWVKNDGPGNLPQTHSSPYAHNEFLQIFAEFGLIGLFLALAGIAATARWLVRTPGDGPMWAGGLAAVVALAITANLDYVWHYAVIPVLGATLVGLLAPEPEDVRPPGASGGG